MQPTEEHWRPVVGYEGLYEVSDSGRIRSLDRMVPYRDGRLRKRRGVMLSIYKGARYEIATLSSGQSPRQIRSFTVHGLVAAAFLGPRPDGLNILHGNGDSHDNRASNLRYGTQSENILDAVGHGTHTLASRSHCKRGHEYTPANTKRRKINDSRICATCAREDARATYARRRAREKADL